MDQALSLDQHVNYLIYSCFYQLGNIAKLRPIVCSAELEMIIHVYFLLSLILFSPAWVRRPWITYKRSTVMRYVTLILISFHRPPIIMFTTLHCQAPTYIKELLQPDLSSRNLRSSDPGLLVVSCSRLMTKGDCAVEVFVFLLWNSLPLDLRYVETFKKLKTNLFRLAFPSECPSSSFNVSSLMSSFSLLLSI